MSLLLSLVEQHYALFIPYIIGVNLLGYLCMIIDKVLAINQWRRIPEKTFFTLGFFCGAPGILLATTVPLYHKKNKTTFRLIQLVFVLMQGCFLIALLQNH
jgi:uncharacterized membrane protein YsdA (DUF1294 family)